MDFFTGGSVTMDYGYILAKSDGLKLKHLDGFVSYKHGAIGFMLTDGLKWCGLL